MYHAIDIAFRNIWIASKLDPFQFFSGVSMGKLY